MERPVKCDIPFNETLIIKAFTELNKFVNVIEKILVAKKSSIKTNNISFAESLAFRILANVDWTCTDLNDLKKEFEPIFNAKHIDLDSLLIKNHCSYLKLKETEKKEALSLWIDWRLNINNEINIIEFSKFETNKKNSLIKQNDDLMLMHALAKWSDDDSTMKFGAYLHHGIPRAKIRDQIDQSNSQSSFEQSKIKMSSPLLRMPYSEDSAIEDSFGNSSVNMTAFNDLSASSQRTCSDQKYNLSSYELLKHETLKKHGDLTDDSGISSPSPSKTFYYRRKYVQSINKKKRSFLTSDKSQKKSINSLNLSEMINSTSDLTLNNMKNNKDIEVKNGRINVVEGGLVTNVSNVYFPTNSKKTNKTFYSDNNFMPNKKDTSFKSNNLKLKSKEFMKRESNIKVNPVKGGLVTKFGNVYFPSK